jgi:hypothetical protein
MNITKPILLKAILTLPWLLSAAPVVAQEDRGERIQESVTSSDDRIDFTKRKAAPSKIESVFYQALLKQKLEAKRAIVNLKEVEGKAKKHAAERGLTTLSSRDQRSIDAARAKVEKALAALKEAECKANAD